MNQDISNLKKIISGGIETDVSIVFCFDCTESMSPCLDTAKRLAKNLFDDLRLAMEGHGRPVRRLKVAVIAFRDYYCEGAIDEILENRGDSYTPSAMFISPFFDLPGSSRQFEAVINGLKAAGGGDEPENSLEALALAMNLQHKEGFHPGVNSKARQVIIMFTDASAHELEKSEQGKPESVYPKVIPTSLSMLKEAWENRSQYAEARNYSMDQDAKRLILYAPLDKYPWNSIKDWTSTQKESIEPAMGGGELNKDTIIRTLIASFN